MPTQRELQRDVLAKNPHYSAGQAKAVAKKILWIEQNGFFEKLRIQGTISDPTAREAVKNIELAERDKKREAIKKARSLSDQEATADLPTNTHS